MHNKKLAIAIPTYNRHEILYEDLKLMLPDLIQYKIAVYISDDSNNDSTLEMVKELSKLHSYVYYSKNSPLLGHDKNILSTLQLPDTDYVWLMGDSVIIKPDKISKILDILNNTPDFIFVNSYVKNASNIIIENITEFMRKHTWYLTLTGATIYNSKIIKHFNAKTEVKYYRNFQQLAIILDHISSNRACVYWLGDETIIINSNKKSYWSTNVIEVFVKDWSMLVKSFPIVFSSPSIINEVIYSHALNTDLFSLKKLLKYRSVGAININIILSNYDLLKVATKSRLFQFFIISALPKSFLLSVRKFIKRDLGT
jgi:GT2 family glycosyltransferase